MEGICLKRKFYKQWQFWLIAVIILFLAAAYGFIVGRASLRRGKTRTIIFNKINGEAQYNNVVCLDADKEYISLFERITI